MKRITALTFAFLIAAIASVSVPAQDDRHKAEVFAGYSYLNTDAGEDVSDPDRVGSHGFEGAVTGNLSRYVGIKGDFSYHRKAENFQDLTTNIDARFRTMQFLGGVQFKDNNKDAGRAKPFAHIMGGVANQQIDVKFTTGTTVSQGSINANSFAMVFGGGLDVRASRKVDIRVFQFDYNPVFLRDRTTPSGTLDGRTQNNFRISVGLVFH